MIEPGRAAPDADEEPAPSRAPPLPIEAPLVRSVRALEALKGQADLALFLLEHAPHQHAQLNSVLNDVVAATNAASAAVWQFTQVRECRGQA